MKKESAIIIILAVLLAASLAFGIIYFQKYSEMSKEAPSEIQGCSAMLAGYIKDACYIELAIDSSNAAGCAKVANADQKDLCYIEVSKVLRDKTLCANVADAFYSRPKCFAELQMMGVF